jgi:6-phosphogluconolactonase
MARADLLIEPTADRAARTAADRICAHLRAAVAAKESASIAFSGGSTPTPMLDALALQSLPWDRIHVFQVDERVAPDGHADRNSTVLCRHLLDRVQTNSYLMDVTAADLADAAERYAQQLRAHEPLDVAHLGMGDDGHTASWPPGASVIHDHDHDVAMVDTYRGFRRMTITPRVVDRAGAVLLLVTGADKAPVFGRLLAGDRSLVASRVIGEHTLVIADEAAVSTRAAG